MQGPGGLPVPVAVGREPPPEGQSVIDYVTIGSRAWEGWYAIDNTPTQAQLNRLWRAIQGVL